MPVPDALINIIRQHLEMLNAADAPNPNAAEFQPGDPVMIQGGPFAGYEGIFNTRLPGRDRVEILLKMLEGPHMRLELSIEQIALQKSQN